MSEVKSDDPGMDTSSLLTLLLSFESCSAQLIDAARDQYQVEPTSSQFQSDGLADPVSASSNDRPTVFPIAFRGNLRPKL